MNFDAGHSHGPTPHLVSDCPLCQAAKAARNQAIGHLSEAIRLITSLNQDGQRTIRLNLGPIGVTGDDTDICHSIDLTAKQAEGLADAVDSMSAHAASMAADRMPAVVDPVPASEREGIPSGDFSAGAVAQNYPGLHAEVRKLFLDVDPESYLDDVFTAESPEASLAAYEQMVTGEWDGEL